MKSYLCDCNICQLAHTHTQQTLIQSWDLNVYHWNALIYLSEFMSFYNMMKMYFNQNTNHTQKNKLKQKKNKKIISTCQKSIIDNNRTITGKILMIKNYKLKCFLVQCPTEHQVLAKHNHRPVANQTKESGVDVTTYFTPFMTTSCVYGLLIRNEN